MPKILDRYLHTLQNISSYLHIFFIKVKIHFPTLIKVLWSQRGGRVSVHVAVERVTVA